MNGFDDLIETMILTCKAENLDDIIQVTHDAKCLDEQPSTDTVLVAVDQKWKELMIDASS